MKSVFRELREKKNLSQKRLSEILGISQSDISKLENGDKKPSVKDLNAYAGYFKVSTDYLTGRSKVSFKNATLNEMAKKTHLSEEAIKRIVIEGSTKSGKSDNRRVVMLDWILSDKKTFNTLMDCMLGLCFPHSLVIPLDRIPGPLLSKDKKAIVISPDHAKELIYDDDPEEIFRRMKAAVNQFVHSVSDRPAPAVNEFVKAEPPEEKEGDALG